MDNKSRRRIGLLLENDDLGVIYYLNNITVAISYLEDNQKPHIVLFYSEDCAKHVSIFKYEYLETYLIKKPSLAIGFLKSKLLNKNYFIQSIEKTNKVEALFPVNLLPVGKSNLKLVSWIPDFQHKFFAHLFKRKNLLMREFRFKSIINNTSVLVLSSEDAYSHLKNFYRIKQSTKIKVLPFVSLMRGLTFPKWSEMKSKYQIGRPYFLISNQFYVHKNHIVAVEALKILRSKGYDFEIIMTGKTEDYRDPVFFPNLVKNIEINGLEGFIKILGLIPRIDQLTLLKNALAVIQPSKFEGWSTIIEDAKSLNQHVICSNIPVHIEQLDKSGFYFNPDSASELAEKMVLFLESKVTGIPIYESEEIRTIRFAQQFLSIFES